MLGQQVVIFSGFTPHKAERLNCAHEERTPKLWEITRIKGWGTIGNIITTPVGGGGFRNIGWLIGPRDGLPRGIIFVMAGGGLVWGLSFHSEFTQAWQDAGFDRASLVIEEVILLPRGIIVESDSDIEVHNTDEGR